MRVVGVGGVLTNRHGEVLLVRTAQVGWELPGGRVEPGEDLIGALRREVGEEAGCAAEVGRLVGVYAHVALELLLVIFRGTSTTQTPAPRSDEMKVLEAAWVDRDEALRRVTHVREHEALADALADAPSVVYRAYDLTT